MRRPCSGKAEFAGGTGRTDLLPSAFQVINLKLPRHGGSLSSPSLSFVSLCSRCCCSVLKIRSSVFFLLLHDFLQEILMVYILPCVGGACIHVSITESLVVLVSDSCLCYRAYLSKRYAGSSIMIVINGYIHSLPPPLPLAPPPSL